MKWKTVIVHINNMDIMQEFRDRGFIPLSCEVLWHPKLKISITPYEIEGFLLVDTENGSIEFKRNRHENNTRFWRWFNEQEKYNSIPYPVKST